MAQTPSDSGSASTNTLPRGKACLRCRKRKMRCDGMKPACGQCTKAKKPDNCQYDDGKGKTRTQALREKIAKLEEELSQLRDPDFSSPSIVLHDPHAPVPPYYSGSSSSSATDSPNSLSLSVSPSPFSSIDSVNSPQTPWARLRALTPPVPYHSEELPSELRHMLLDIFLPHRHQCGFALHAEHLRSNISLPLADQRHPVLMNAIFLWACFFSRPGPFSQHEAHYLAKTQEALVDALQQPKRIIDTIQACAMLAKYYFANGRNLEASFHASSAATMAIHAGLHRTASTQAGLLPWTDVTKGSALLPLDPPKDAAEQGERIAVFWQVFIIDRTLSVALQRPTCIPEDCGFYTRIDTPWPEDIEEYDNMSLDAIQGDSTLRMFFTHQGQTLSGVGGFSTSALRVKAAALYERGTRMAATWGHSPSQQAEFHAFDLTLSRFLSNLLPVQQLDATLPEDRRDFVSLHMTAHASTIQLHQSFAREDTTSFEKCLRAARHIVALVKHIADPDYEYLDPIIGGYWASAASILALEQVTWATVDHEVQHDLDTIIFAITKLHARFPLAAMPQPVGDNEFQQYPYLT
ncbi:hypothetical protein BD410DRAFT_287744 [Rickenella mellea]|uniref:Zn(2)-C6 fungal-type domain-containing protein n=1 Tax=Rickenella mellea TaxID=50990 RepID=A0A4Y7Q3B6_9AGAM|nr:hypothetical protein BD410DRAFT_287744 [Rickenella mellea]